MALINVSQLLRYRYSRTCNYRSMILENESRTGVTVKKLQVHPVLFFIDLANGANPLARIGCLWSLKGSCPLPHNPYRIIMTRKLTRH